MVPIVRVRFPVAAHQQKFLPKYVDKIVYHNEKVAFHGFVPVETEVREQTEVAKLEFVFKETISYADRIKRPKGPIGGSVQIGRKEYDKLAGN